MHPAGFTSGRPHRPEGDDASGGWRPSRRVWLISACTLTGGAIIGWFAGGKVAEASAATAAAENDPMVDWVRGVISDPQRVGELRHHYHGLIYALHKVPEDPVVWDGFRQLVVYLESNPADVPAVLLARTLFQELDYNRPRMPDLESVLERLRELAK